METIYLSLRSQVAVGTFFMKSPVAQTSTNIFFPKVEKLNISPFIYQLL